METKVVLVVLLMLVGSQTSAASILIENEISWTTAFTRLEAIREPAALNPYGNRPGYGLASFRFAQGIETQERENSGKGTFRFSTGPTPGWSVTNWSDNDREMNLVAATAPTIVLGVEHDAESFESGADFTMLWENLAGDNNGNYVSEDLSAVPLPAAAWLFASALLGLSVVARRRDVKSQKLV